MLVHEAEQIRSGTHRHEQHHAREGLDEPSVVQQLTQASRTALRLTLPLASPALGRSYEQVTVQRPELVIGTDRKANNFGASLFEEPRIPTHQRSLTPLGFGRASRGPVGPGSAPCCGLLRPPRCPWASRKPNAISLAVKDLTHRLEPKDDDRPQRPPPISGASVK
jgi:hypothetical protein